MKRLSKIILTMVLAITCLLGVSGVVYAAEEEYPQEYVVKAVNETYTGISKVTSVKMNKTSVKLNYDSEPFVLTIKEVKSKVKNSWRLRWSVTNPEVATISRKEARNMYVIPLKEGKTYVTLTDMSNKKVVKKIAVTVKGPKKVSSVSVKKSSYKLAPGVQQPLTVTVKPAKGVPDRSVTWASDNEAVATVDQNGLVTTHAAGKAKITATSNSNSKKKGKCTITVK